MSQGGKQLGRVAVGVGGQCQCQLRRARFARKASGSGNVLAKDREAPGGANCRSVALACPAARKYTRTDAGKHRKMEVGFAPLKTEN